MSYQLHTSECENPQTAGHVSSRYRLNSFQIGSTAHGPSGSGPPLGHVSGPHGPLVPDDVAEKPERV